MKYVDFENIMSKPRMDRYLFACNNDTRKAMTLYRANLNLSQQMFTVVSCFELAIRNQIDQHYTLIIGAEWLKKSIQTGGCFSMNQTIRTKKIIQTAYNKLGSNYTQINLLLKWISVFGATYSPNLNSTLLEKRYFKFSQVNQLTRFTFSTIKHLYFTNWKRLTV